MAEGKQFDFNEIRALDDQIETLFSCKPLPESQIQILCEKVRTFASEGARAWASGRVSSPRSGHAAVRNEPRRAPGWRVRRRPLNSG